MSDQKPYRWEDAKGVIHDCERSSNIGHENLMWTKCLIDVPANTGFKSWEDVTCEKCNEAQPS